VSPACKGVSAGEARRVGPVRGVTGSRAASTCQNPTQLRESPERAGSVAELGVDVLPDI